VTYYDSDASPCACFADGVAIATHASFGQSTVTLAAEKAPPGTLAAMLIRHRKGGPGFNTVPIAALSKLGRINDNLDARGRYEALKAADDLFQVEASP
jgi:hypothetical protein